MKSFLNNRGNTDSRCASMTLFVCISMLVLDLILMPFIGKEQVSYKNPAVIIETVIMILIILKLMAKFFSDKNNYFLNVIHITVCMAATIIIFMIFMLLNKLFLVDGIAQLLVTQRTTYTLVYFALMDITTAKIEKLSDLILKKNEEKIFKLAKKNRLLTLVIALSIFGFKNADTFIEKVKAE